MFSPLFFVLMSGVQQKSSVPCPISQAKGTKLLILSSAVPPGFHPCTDAGRLSERRNGAWPFCTTAVSHRPLRSELQHRYTRKPSQPVKLLSLPCTPCLLSPSLRLGVFRFYNQELCYHISGQFARGLYVSLLAGISLILAVFYFQSQHQMIFTRRPSSQHFSSFSGCRFPSCGNISISLPKSPPFQEVSDKFCHHTDSARSAYNRGKLHPRKNGSYPPSLP